MSDKRDNRFFAQKSRPLVLGHRGTPWLHQENSLAGIRRALSLGADGVEFDVFLTKDQKVVVFHDEDLYRLTGERGRITDLTWDQVSRLRLQRQIHMGQDATGQEVVMNFDHEEPVPLLEEVLTALKGRAAIDIELKPASPKHGERALGAAVAEIVERVGVGDQVLITSFDFFKLAAAKEAHRTLHTGFAYDDNTLDAVLGFLQRIPEFPSSLARAMGNQNAETLLNWLAEIDAVGRYIDSSAINIEHTLIDEDTISKLHARGLAVGSYTLLPLDTAYVKRPVSEAEGLARARELAAQGLDWFETDDPVKLLAALG
jgi:glycerophosphoryl diester phosphodiesterase